LFALFELLGSTLAWFTSADARVNSMETPPDKHFSILAVDEFDPDPDDEGLYSKRVGAVNAAEKPGYARLLVFPMFLLENPDGPPTLLPASIGGPGSGAYVIMDDLNLTDWLDASDLDSGGDGFFYYKYLLEPGQSTHPDHNLFNLIRINDNLPTDYQNARLVIEVKCEAQTTIWPALGE